VPSLVHLVQKKKDLFMMLVEMQASVAYERCAKGQSDPRKMHICSSVVPPKIAIIRRREEFVKK